MSPVEKRVLVTGGTGFIGSHVVDELLEAGYRVRCTVRSTSDTRWLDGKAVDRVEADLSSAELSAAVEGCESVVHCAGLTRGSREALQAANHDGTRRLLAACGAGGARIRFVFCSSQAASGPSTPERPRAEDDPPRPNSDYGRSKLAAEEEVKRWSDRLDVVVLRPAAVYGPRDEDTLPFFQMAARGVIVVPGLRRRALQMVHAQDVAAAARLALEKAAATGRTYFVAHPEVLSWDEVAAALARAVDRQAFRLRVPAPVLRSAGLLSQLAGVGGRAGGLDRRKARDLAALAWTCRVERALNELGWEPAYDCETGLAVTTRWYRERGWV